MTSVDDLINDLAALQKPRKSVGQVLPAAPQASIIGASSGKGFPRTGGGDSNIASPLTELSRTLHVTTIKSTDGLFVWEPVNQLTMLDANSNTVVFIYASAP